MNKYLFLIPLGFVLLMSAPDIRSSSFVPEKSAVVRQTQIRIFTINRGKMEAFIDAWQKEVYPLRIKNGFKIEGAWTVKEKNKFIWILSYEGPEGFEAKDSAYYASENRKNLLNDPVQYIADVEKYFISPVLK